MTGRIRRSQWQRRASVTAPARDPFRKPCRCADGDLVRKADKEGDISFKGRRIRLGRPFRGEWVALRPAAEDGVFKIHFGCHHIGAVDLRAGEVACGFVDIATAMPTSSTGQQQPHNTSDLVVENASSSCVPHVSEQCPP
jgi:hypothetical protein